MMNQSRFGALMHCLTFRVVCSSSYHCTGGCETWTEIRTDTGSQNTCGVFRILDWADYWTAVSSTCLRASVAAAHIDPSRSPGVKWLRLRGMSRWWSQDLASPPALRSSSSHLSPWMSRWCGQSHSLNRVIENWSEESGNCFRQW